VKYIITAASTMRILGECWNTCTLWLHQQQHRKFRTRGGRHECAFITAWTELRPEASGHDGEAGGEFRKGREEGVNCVVCAPNPRNPRAAEIGPFFVKNMILFIFTP